MFNLFKKNKKKEYKFNEPENTACFTCEHIFNGERNILFVTHEVEGDWQFLCGQEDHTSKDIKIISLKQVTEIDESVNYLYEMPLGIGSERKNIECEWEHFKL